MADPSLIDPASAVLAALTLGARPALARSPATTPTMEPWGSPLRVLEPAEKRHRPAREDGPAWGRTVWLTPQAQKTGVIRVSLEHPEQLTLAIDVLQGAAPKGSTTYHVWAQVTFGSGGANAVRNVNCDYRFDVPLCASYVDVMLYLGDAAGVPITATNAAAQAQVTAQLARGVRGLPYSATLFTVGSGVSSATAGAPKITVPARLVSVSAHLDQNGAVQDCFLQLFDATSAPAVGATPAVEFAIGSVDTDSAVNTQEFGRQSNFRGFANGIWYEVSYTSGSLTRPTPGDAIAWVELETLQL